MAPHFHMHGILLVLSLSSPCATSTSLGGKHLPHWTAQAPNASLPHSGLPLLQGIVHSTVFNATISQANGTYNHGPIITFFNHTFLLTWYNGPVDESHMNRVLMSISKDAKSWSEPVEVFPVVSKTGPTGKGEQNEPFAIVSGRLYAAASDISWGNSHKNGTRGGLIMRQVALTGMPDGSQGLSFGEPFWLDTTPPQGIETYGYKTFLEMGAPVVADMTEYLSTLVNETVSDPHFNERSLYALPSLKENRLVLLLRGKEKQMFASTCTSQKANAHGQSSMASKPSMGMCIAGTGAYMFEEPAAGVLDSSASSMLSAHSHSLVGPRQCNWTKPEATNIETATSRTCAGWLPDSRVWVLGSLGSKTRDILTVSVASDGLAFSESYVVNWNPPPIRYPGHAKCLGFQYPSGVWHGKYGYAAYSINKEDIVVSRFPLASLDAKPSRIREALFV